MKWNIILEILIYTHITILNQCLCHLLTTLMILQQQLAEQASALEQKTKQEIAGAGDSIARDLAARPEEENHMLPLQ